MLTAEQLTKVQCMESFVEGYVYQFYTLLVFTEICDMKVRAILHPTPFIFQELTSGTTQHFKLNFNPTPEQMVGMRHFLDKLRNPNLALDAPTTMVYPVSPLLLESK